jgi:hypothetical protein
MKKYNTLMTQDLKMKFNLYKKNKNIPVLYTNVFDKMFLCFFIKLLHTEDVKYE